MDGVKNAINVITPEDSKIFQCISATTKNEWIDKFEVALKFNQIKKKKNQAPQPPSRPVSAAETNVRKTATKTSLASSKTASITSTSSEVEIPNVRYAPEWVVSAQEEIHTLIAQRHFGEALSLITKCEEFFAKDSSVHNATEIIQKVRLLKIHFEIRKIVVYSTHLHYRSNNSKMIYQMFFWKNCRIARLEVCTPLWYRHESNSSC